MRKIVAITIFIILAFVSTNLNAQSFEGTITYKMVANNPMPEMITDSAWQEGLKEQFGERGYIVQKFYYKEGKYMAEIDAVTTVGFQAYNPKDKLLYNWEKDSKEAMTLDSRKYLDKIVEIKDGEETETILGIVCKSIIITSEFGTMTVWYNSDHLKINPTYYKGFIYGHWEQILNRIGCLPLKINQDSFAAKITQTAIEYNAETVNDAKFEIPKFKTVSANPMN